MSVSRCWLALGDLRFVANAGIIIILFADERKLEYAELRMLLSRRHGRALSSCLVTDFGTPDGICTHEGYGTGKGSCSCSPRMRKHGSYSLHYPGEGGNKHVLIEIRRLLLSAPG